MLSVDDSFYTWLAAQPAFVEVAIGVAFVVVVAPALLAAVAAAITQLEDLLLSRTERSAPSTSRRRAHPIIGLPRTS